jgi:hypothetical protein
MHQRAPADGGPLHGKILPRGAIEEPDRDGHVICVVDGRRYLYEFNEELAMYEFVRSLEGSAEDHPIA